MLDHVIEMTAVVGQLPKLDEDKIKKLEMLSDDTPMSEIQNLIVTWEEEEFLEFKEVEVRAKSGLLNI